MFAYFDYNDRGAGQTVRIFDFTPTLLNILSSAHAWRKKEISDLSAPAQKLRNNGIEPNASTG